MNEAINTLSKMVESLEERIEKKLDFLNKSNAAMSLQIQVLSPRLATLENQFENVSLTDKQQINSGSWIWCKS